MKDTYSSLTGLIHLSYRESRQENLPVFCALLGMVLRVLAEKPRTTSEFPRAKETSPRAKTRI
jgi:hypothetical protein